MNENAIIISGLLILSIISGMLGLGVAFAAIPFLGLFLPDLVHQVQPLSLLLNGVTALFAVFGFARSGNIVWKQAFILAAITTVAAPVGSLLAQFINQTAIWFVYFAAVVYLAYRLFRPIKEKPSGSENFRLVLIMAVPISVLSGFLGVGPGFLLMPTLMIAGFNAKKSAGINAFAVTPPSFSALVPHLATARFDPSLTFALLCVGAIGSFSGARITSLYVPPARIKQIFGILIIITTLYKIYTLLR
jgi:uncharacterized membrane protein YfcA